MPDSGTLFALYLQRNAKTAQKHIFSVAIIKQIGVYLHLKKY